MKRPLFVAFALMLGGVAMSAQRAAGPRTPSATTATDAAKIRTAMNAGPTDVSKNASIMEMDEQGEMKQLRPGTNGWTCMLMPDGPGVSDAMCMDKTWSAWA